MMMLLLLLLMMMMFISRPVNKVHHLLLFDIPILCPSDSLCFLALQGRCARHWCPHLPHGRLFAQGSARCVWGVSTVQVWATGRTTMGGEILVPTCSLLRCTASKRTERHSTMEAIVTARSRSVLVRCLGERLCSLHELVFIRRCVASLNYWIYVTQDTFLCGRATVWMASSKWLQRWVPPHV
mgnify:CR=1 FL=1